MDLIYDDDHIEVEIIWGRPKPLAGLKAPEDSNDLLYLITAQATGVSERMIYIGQAYSVAVAERVAQSDHRKKQAVWRARFPGHTFHVRLGRVRLNHGKISVPKLNAIEAILIYAFDSDDCCNQKSKFRPSIAKQYEIRNKGSKVGLPKRLGYGFYCQY